LARVAPTMTPGLVQPLPRRRVLEAALPDIERKVALVIGVNNYDDKSIPRLTNAVRDADSVARMLNDKLGYETLVLKDATRATVVGALNRLALELRPSDSLIVYYAGHGQQIASTGLGYWLLSDAGANEAKSWLSNTDISRLLAAIDSRQIAMVSDSCYSGSLVPDQPIRAVNPGVDPKAVLSRKSVVVMSSGGNQPVFDEGRNGHSPFAWNFMNTLRDVSLWQAGGQVFERVRFRVAREVPQRPRYGAANAAGHQAGGEYLFEYRELDVR
jgi:Caspase domain